MSWRTERAKEIWEGILNGDCAQYQNTKWEDIPEGEMECIEGDWSDYDVETYINKTLLDNDYRWGGDQDDLGLIKK